MRQPPSDTYPFGVGDFGETGTLLMHAGLEVLETLMERMSPDERERFADGVARALNVYVVSAKFENPPQWKIPPEFPMPKSPEPTPASPRTP